MNNERSGTPLVLADPSDIRVEYNIVENDDDFLKTQDTNYPTWIQMMPRYGFGDAIDPIDGKIRGLTGSKRQSACPPFRTRAAIPPPRKRSWSIPWVGRTATPI